MGLRVLKVWEYWRFEIFEGLKLPIQAFEIIQNSRILWGLRLFGWKIVWGLRLSLMWGCICYMVVSFHLFSARFRFATKSIPRLLPSFWSFWNVGSHPTLMFFSHVISMLLFSTTFPRSSAELLSSNSSLVLCLASNPRIARALRLGPTRPVTNFWGWRISSSWALLWWSSQFRYINN